MAHQHCRLGLRHQCEVQSWQQQQERVELEVVVVDLEQHEEVLAVVEVIDQKQHMVLLVTEVEVIDRLGMV